MKLSLYVHIPFCVKKCRYCDFLSFVYDEETKERYVTRLLEEIRIQSMQYKGMEVDTVFFGGGTPTHLNVKQICLLMEEIRDAFSVSPDAEISVEMNPGTADYKKIKCLRNAGFNRLSIGVQSMNSEELKLLGRIHTKEEFLRCYEDARRAGFENINVDLMSALPGQTWDTFAPSLRDVVSLQPEHLSVYSLIIEEGTPFFELYGSKDGEKLLPDEDTDREIYHRTLEYLEKNGYGRYEISNYARPGYECKHNLGYWSGKNYVGLGLGAASMVDGVRWKNTSDMAVYLAGENITVNRHALSTRERMEEYMFLGLRKTKGVSVSDFYELFGNHMDSIYGDWIDKMKKNGLLWGDEFLALTGKGQDLANYVMAGFLLE